MKLRIQGGVLGGLMSFATNYSSDAGGMASSTYLFYMIIMFAGALSGFFVLAV